MAATKIDSGLAAWAAAMKTKYDELKRIRGSKEFRLHPTPLLKTEVENNGKLEPFRFRYYQYIGLYHMIVMDRFLLGDGTGLGKTIEVIGALAYLWSRQTAMKVIVVTPKSALWQWSSEILKFMNGVRPIVASGSIEDRKRAYEEFRKAPTGPGDPKVVLLLNYAILVRDWDHGGFQPVGPTGKPDPKQPVLPGLLDGCTANIPHLMVVFDEATAFKNPRTKTWAVCQFLSMRASRCYGLTATLLKNNLIEGFAIYKVLLPRLFKNKTAFISAYCHTRLQSVKGSNRKIQIITGYKNLEDFRARIDPFFLGRPKHEVSKELPQLVTKQIPCELSHAEIEKYDEALSGVLVLGDGEVKDYQETKAMASLIYCQEIVNSLSLLKFEISLSAKESALLELLGNELDGEKVIIYSRFEKFITRLTGVLKDAEIKSVRITGAENDMARRAARETFQDMNSGTNVIFISDAGSEAINLQAAGAMIFMDAPWSWGTYVQLLGRPIRIGSVHETVNVYHLVAVRPGKTTKKSRTIDQHVLDLLQMKKEFIDSVTGEAALGALTFEKTGSFRDELVSLMKQDLSV